MSIVDELKRLIAKRGGSTAGVMTIADAVKVLTKLEGENAAQTTEPAGQGES